MRSRLLHALGLVIALTLVACGGALEESDPLPIGLDTPVVLIVIDTLRADHLSCYGYELETSPTLDAFARQSFLFENNSTQCNATFGSLTSILTGLYVKSHRNYLPVPIEGQSSRSEGAACLAERLGAAGYHTIAAISHPSWHDADRDAAVLQGWDQCSFIGPPIPRKDRPLYAHAEHTNERLFPMLDAYQSSAVDQPLFLWAHYFDPHTDLKPFVYNAPPETRNLFLKHHLDAVGQGALFEELSAVDPRDRSAWIKANIRGGSNKKSVVLANGRALYDAEIRSCDAGIARLFDQLKAMGIYDRALIAVMADHGENMETPQVGINRVAFTHYGLFEGVSHTPLILKLPGQAEGLRVDALTQNIDLAPTLLQLLGMAVDPPVDGETLVPLLAAPETSEVHELVYTESADAIEIAVKSNDLKYVDRGENLAPLVYDLNKDPGELQDLASDVDAERLALLEEAVEGFRPVHSLRISLNPAEEPYEASIQLHLPRSHIEDVVGAPTDTVDAERTHFSWSGTVDGEAVDMVLFLRRRESEMTWTIRHSGTHDLASAVILGERPLARTTAIPIWRPTGESPTLTPLIHITHDSDAHSVTIATPGGPGELIAEARYRRTAYERHLTLTGSTGFGAFEEIGGRVYQASAPAGTPAQLTVQHEPDQELYWMMRFDGHWPDPGRIAIDGRAVRRDQLEFVFPYPADKRLIPYLLTGRSEDPPPGSIAIWMDSGIGGAEIDTSDLDPALIEQLRSIGYLGDQDSER